MDDSASIMCPYFANQTCDPFTSRSSPCTLGNMVQYTVDVRNASDVVNTINFARAHNIRFVIRNTGHDYLGRSTGAGALSVWTHHLKDISLKDWDDSYYSGKAVKIGAGVQGYDVMAALKGTGYIVVGGECPTVGLAGGYTQGGGHSALSSSFGLSADNTLEWEVITANGTHLTATRTQNSDLYWALSGGGSGNYGVVMSLTVKAHPDSHIGGAALYFGASDNPGDKFWEAVDVFHAALPAMVDAGAMVIYDLTDQVSYTLLMVHSSPHMWFLIHGQQFVIAPLTAWNKTEAEVRTIMAPYVSTLDTIGVKYLAVYNQSTSYYNHYSFNFGPLPYGSVRLGVDNSSGRVGGRLIPRTTALTPLSNAALGKAARFVAEQGIGWAGVSVNVSSHWSVPQNAVNPAWRDTLVHVILSSSLNASAPAQHGLPDLMTKLVVPALELVTPGSGAYMNEADYQQPNFQREFFGTNYQKLLGIKKKYDPEGLFYAVRAVGSEAWDVTGDGRLCKTGS